MKLDLRTVIIFTGNMALMTRFYRDVLGLKAIENEDGWVRFDAGGCRIALHGGKAKVGARAPKLSFHAKDVAAAKALLESRGVALGRIVAAGDLRFCDGKDPDGNGFQLSNRS